MSNREFENAVYEVQLGMIEDAENIPVYVKEYMKRRMKVEFDKILEATP